MNELDMARVEMVIELNNEFVIAIKKIVKTHGDDPRLAHIIASAFTMSIGQIDKLSPGFNDFMIVMLKDEHGG